MTTVLVQQRVPDFDAWKAVHDRVSEIRRAAGVRRDVVQRMIEDPNMVVVTHEFDEIESARTFLATSPTKAAMAAAGVSPVCFQVLFLEDVGEAQAA